MITYFEIFNFIFQPFDVNLINYLNILICICTNDKSILISNRFRIESNFQTVYSHFCVGPVPPRSRTNLQFCREPFCFDFTFDLLAIIAAAHNSNRPIIIESASFEFSCCFVHRSRIIINVLFAYFGYLPPKRFNNQRTTRLPVILHLQSFRPFCFWQPSQFCTSTLFSTFFHSHPDILTEAILAIISICTPATK